MNKVCDHNWVWYQPLRGDGFECCSKCPMTKKEWLNPDDTNETEDKRIKDLLEEFNQAVYGYPTKTKP